MASLLQVTPYEFQVEAITALYDRPTNVLVWDMGTGKSVVTLASACLLFEDDLIDLVVVAAEANKIGEVDGWVAETRKVGALAPVLYHGTPKKRAKIRATIDQYQVLVSTYETIRNDAVVFKRNKRGKINREDPTPGPLLEAMAGKRVLLVYDEISAKLAAKRTSALYRGHHFLIKELRRRGELRSVALTGTPVERNPEGTFNYIRLLWGGVGTVKDFKRNYVSGYDLYGEPRTFHNLSADLMHDPNITPFAEKIAPILLRKRKSDPEVREQFPPKSEDFRWVELSKVERDFYSTVDDVFSEDEDLQRGLYGTLRMIAGHPASLLGSQSKIANKIVDVVGPEFLRSLPTSKLNTVAEYLEPLVKGQGAQVVVFTYYGQALLPLIRKGLEEVGLRITSHHGALSHAAREKALAEFRGGHTDVFLTSDAGSRGLNLPEATYVINYELPLLYSVYSQRIDRIHRVGGTLPVTATSFIAAGTVEESTRKLVVRRNRWSDMLADPDMIASDTDEDKDDLLDGWAFLSAEDRNELMKAGRKHAK